MKQEAQHTPGPWKAHRIKEHFSGVTDLYQIHWSDDGECVAEIVHGEANARLIAAGPDLLELLHCILMQHRTDGAYSSRGGVSLSRAMEANIEAAIAKAKGGAA